MMVSGMRLPKCLPQRAEDRRAVGLHRRHVLQVLGRETAAQIDHRQRHAALAAVAEHRGRRGERPVPGMRVALLRADVERDAVSLKAQSVRVLEHVDRHGRLAAELARQRPFRPDAVEEDAAEHPAARRGAGDLLDLGLAIDREQAHAERVGARDVALLLDGVAVGDAVGGGAGREHHLDLGDRGGVEAGAEAGKQRQHLRRRVRLHGVEHARVGQRLGEAAIVFAHDVEIDDEAGPRRRGDCAGNRGCARSLALSSPGSMSLAARIEIQATSVARRQRVRVGAVPCGGDTDEGDGLSTRDAALAWSGMTRSARPARMDKPLRCRPLEGRRDQKSPLRRCFKPRPPLSAGCAGFASGCRLSGSELRRPMKTLGDLLRAAVRPLVRMPTDRHAATGTCEIGRARHNLVV